MQRIIALLPLGHRHPAVAGLEAHPVGIDHRKFAAALAEPLPLSCRCFGVDAATLQQAFGDLLKVDLAEVNARANRGEIVVDDALEHHRIALFPGVEVMEDKALRCVDHLGALAREGAAIAGDQPELGLPFGVRFQALGGTFLPQDKGQRVEVDGVLPEHSPVGRDGEVMQKGKAVEAVAAVMQEAAVGGEFHQPHRAARPGFDPEGHHARVTVVAGIKTWVGTEGFTGLEHPVEPAQAAGFEAVWIEGMGFCCFPERQ